jgi:ribonuclease PH
MQIANKPGGWVTAEYAMLPRSTITRTPREVNGTTGRTQEIRRLIGRSLRSAVNLEKLGTRTLIIDCDVIQADGSTRTAAITGGYLAMAIGLNRLVKTGEIPEDVITGCVAAVSVGIIDQKVALDLDYYEDSQADVDVNIVMNNHGEFVEVQASAEHKAFSQDQLDEILKLARQGIDHLINIQYEYINEAS